MRVFTLEVQLTLPRPIDEVFSFFADAGNLEAITPPWLKFAITTPRPIAMQRGALIDYRLRLRGVPINWRTRITEWSPPNKFVDMQLRGPYSLWHHTHTFEPARTVNGREGTLVLDKVRYAVPFGGLARTLFVRPQIDAIFRYRQHAMMRLILGEAEAQTLPPPPPPSPGAEESMTRESVRQLADA